mmetsp:Transcript_5393/g.11997  ORF Transcript_5393/g.11997 Transcript_5393/m.11997 type:complete len:130 (+) Transcript_5393:7320-7709(+)
MLFLDSGKRFAWGTKRHCTVLRLPFTSSHRNEDSRVVVLRETERCEWCATVGESSNRHCNMSFSCAILTSVERLVVLSVLQSILLRAAEYKRQRYHRIQPTLSGQVICSQGFRLVRGGRKVSSLNKCTL